MAEAQAKANPKGDMAEKFAAKKEEYENLVNELEELKENYSDCKDERKSQLAESRREISEYKFEVRSQYEPIVGEAKGFDIEQSS